MNVNQQMAEFPPAIRAALEPLRARLCNSEGGWRDLCALMALLPSAADEPVAWDEGSPCVEPRPVGMVYPPKPAPRASGYLPDGSGVEWNAYDTAQMESYARAAYADGFAAASRPASARPSAGVDPWTPSDADYDRSIHTNPDAAAWADFFVATFPGQAAQRDLMLGWFANAMMAMHDHLAHKRPSAGVELALSEQKSLEQRAMGWDAVCCLLFELRPEWTLGTGSGIELATAAIREALVAPVAPAAEGWAEDLARAVELAERLVAPGPKASHVSASECHEIADFIMSLATNAEHAAMLAAPSLAQPGVE